MPFKKISPCGGTLPQRQIGTTNGALQACGVPSCNDTGAQSPAPSRATEVIGDLSRLVPIACVKRAENGDSDTAALIEAYNVQIPLQARKRRACQRD